MIRIFLELFVVDFSLSEHTQVCRNVFLPLSVHPAPPPIVRLVQGLTVVVILLQYEKYFSLLLEFPPK